MSYEIKSRSDLAKGLILEMRIPEAELDEKALYTIQADAPDFIVPFHYRSVDGEIEFSYAPGARCKLQYLYAPRSPEQCRELWSAVLDPLLACTDWFMQPFSFVLDPQYLYYDKAGKRVSYLYLPSRRTRADQDTLKAMAAELSRQNPVTDARLENRILRSIMQDFQPEHFLAMLREWQSAPVEAAPPPRPVSHETPPPPQCVVERQEADDIKICLPGEGKTAESGRGKVKEGKGLFATRSKEKKKKNGLFSKKGTEQEIIMGAVQQPMRGMDAGLEPPPVRPPEPQDDVTQLDLEESGGPRLRLVGDGSLPREIEVHTQPGQPYTIGRFDTSVGKRQSSFEFEARTKAVSRRHAAIERLDSGYAVVDLSSSAGTFVDGQRLAPNVPHPLKRGMRVSFGNHGADYIWEE